MDWTEDAGLHQRFKDWREEVELLIDTVLSHIKNADTKMKFVTLWAGKEARTYLNTLEQDQHDSVRTILYSLEEWTKPKSDEIAAFTHLRTINQGKKTLSSYIQEVRRVVDLCNFMCVGDCKDRLIRNSIVAGLSSTKAYQQSISKGSNLTLNECIRICQTEDATCRQVQALRPESTDCTDSTPIHHMNEYPQARPRTNLRGRRGYRGPFRGGRPSHRGSMGGACSQRDYRYSTETTCGYCGSWPHRTGEECKAVGQECHHCGRLGHFSKVCRQRSDYQNSENTAVKHIDMEEQPPDYFQSEYTTPYFFTNEQAKAPIKCLKTTARVHHIQDRHTEHIRPLWVSQSRGEDPHLAILTYATTPLNHSLPSPAELLNSRRYRCILPVRVKQQNLTHKYRNIMQKQKQQQTRYYNRNARDLPSLKTGRPVYVQLVPKTRNWIPVHIIEKLSQRTYKIKAYNGGVYVRNRKFIKP